LVPFKTEIGMMSIPTMEAVRAMMPAADLEPFPNDDWAEHDFALGGGNNSANVYRSTLTARYGDVGTLARFVRAAQLANYEAARAMYEGRMAKLFAPSTAVIMWMSNPAQPSFTWQIYSYDLEPFATYFAVRAACESVHVMLDQSDDHVRVINHLPTATGPLRVRRRVVDLDGRVRSDDTVAVNAPAGATTDLGALPFPATLSTVHFVALTLMDARGAVLSKNVYWRNGAAENDFRALDSLPPVTLDAALQHTRSASIDRFVLRLHNPTTHVALMAHAQLRDERTGERILPVRYSDNYITLMPGERADIAIEADAPRLAGRRARIVVDGWNVTVRATSVAAGSVAPSEPATIR
jgi:beta-mannosidase